MADSAKKLENLNKPESQDKTYEDALGVMAQFASALGHEINTPLSVIMMLAEDITEEIEAAEIDTHQVSENAKGIIKTATAIADIIQSLRSYNQMDFKKPFRKVRVSEVLKAAKSLCQETIDMGQVSLRVNPVDSELSLSCRITEVTQVLVNLLKNSTNAVRRLDERWIEIDVQLKNEMVIFRVKDSGSGIDELNRQKIFDPFFSNDKKSGGMGLGLALCRTIVEAHGGEIFVDDKSKNTEFVVRLPQVPADIFYSKGQR